MLLKYTATLNGHHAGDIEEVFDVTDARLLIARGLAVLASEQDTLRYLKQHAQNTQNKMVASAPINKATRPRRKRTTKQPL